MTLLGSSSSLKKRSSVALAPDADEDAQLLENPLDLVCPITHELFRDPVINSAGQVHGLGNLAEQQVAWFAPPPPPFSSQPYPALVPSLKLRPEPLIVSVGI